MEVEIVDIDPDYEDSEVLRKYEKGLRNDSALKEQKFTVAHFEGGEYDPWPHEEGR